jgi:hypothetical protein
MTWLLLAALFGLFVPNGLFVYWLDARDAAIDPSGGAAPHDTVPGR